MDDHLSNEAQLRIYKQKIWYGNHIRKIAATKHITCSELSILSGIGEEFIDKLWHSEAVPSRNQLQKLSIALEVPVEMLELPSNY